MIWFFDKGGAFAGAVFRMFEAALPFENSPAFEIVCGELAENGFEVDLSVAQGAEAARAVDPGLVAAIDALAAGGIEFGVLDMEHADAFVIDVDIFEVVEALQDEVRRVIEQAGAGMVIRMMKEGLVGDAVVQVFSGMDLIAKVYAVLVKFVQDGKPAGGEFFETGFY